ncbi:MAG: hypothetical protein ACOCTQ_05050 [Planctomycetota bacterium]
MSEVIKTKVTGKKDKIRTLHYEIDDEDLTQLRTTRAGRTLLVTDRLPWEPGEVMRTYRGLARIEDAFRNMKNPYYLRCQPSWHWTNQKFRVRGFNCVVALTLVRLARKVTWEAGQEL